MASAGVLSPPSPIQPHTGRQSSCTPPIAPPLCPTIHQSRSNCRGTVSAAASPSVQDHTLPRRRRRKSSSAASSQSPPPHSPVRHQPPVNHVQGLGHLASEVGASSSSSSIGAPAAGPASRKQRRTRLARLHEDAHLLVDSLVSRTQLPRAVAEKVVRARSGTPYVTSNPDKLCARVQHLQQLLGAENAEMALRRTPHLVSYR